MLKCLFIQQISPFTGFINFHIRIFLIFLYQNNYHAGYSNCQDVFQFGGLWQTKYLMTHQLCMFCGFGARILPLNLLSELVLLSAKSLIDSVTCNHQQKVFTSCINQCIYLLCCEIQSLCKMHSLAFFLLLLSLGM